MPHPRMLLLVGCLVLGGILSARAADEFPEVVNTQAPEDRPPTAAEAVERMQVPPGFEVRLFAGEPDVRQPIAMTTDDRGRLWVAECYTYAGNHFDEEMQDRIVIFTDVDQDGHYDRRHVFWDGGKFLSGLEIGFGGVWALNAGELLFIPDHNGDDQPDGPPEVRLDGFSLEAAHNIVNGLLWGPDGWLYGRHGILDTSLPGAPDTPVSERVAINCGIWRYHPTRQVIEAVAHGTTNPWGLDYDDYGEFFFTNNVIGHLWHLIPGAHYRRMYGEDFNPYLFELIDQHADHYHWDTGENWTDSRDAVGVHGQLGGGHSHCGGMIYLGDNWPAEYRNRIFMCNTHGRRVNQDILQRSGCGYIAQHGEDFLFANQPWFRGVTLLYGPDGGVYLSDWTDLGECHDHDGVHRTSGRIYKVTYGQPERLPDGFDLAKRSSLELVELQLHENDWFVRHARRLLQERAAAGQPMQGVRSRLLEIYDTHADTRKRLRALWALQVIGAVDAAWLTEQLQQTDEHQRVWAVRLLTDEASVTDEVAGALVERGRDESSGLVRLYLASALQRMSGDARWELAQALASYEQDADDPNQPLMIWYGIEPQVTQAPDRALALLEATSFVVLRRHVARRLTGQLEEQPELAEQLVARLGTLSAAAQRDALQGMADALKGWRKAPAPRSWTEVQPVLQASPDEEVKRLAQELAVVFGDGRAIEALRKVALDSKEMPSTRRRAIEVLASSGSEDFSELLIRLLADRDVAASAVQSLAQYDDPQIAQELVNRYRGFKEDARQQALEILSARPQFARVLLEAVRDEQIPADAITAFQARQIASLNDEGLNELLGEVWGVVRATSEEKHALIQRFKTLLTPDLLAEADLAAGRATFNKLCANCHTLYGQGGKVGPDLTGANRDNLDYLLENTIDPSSTVAAQFRMSVVLLADGRVINGVVGLESGATVTIQTADEKITVRKDEIDEQQESPVSLMPDGLLQQLTDEQVRDLIGYLNSPEQVPLPESP